MSTWTAYKWPRSNKSNLKRIYSTKAKRLDSFPIWCHVPIRRSDIVKLLALVTQNLEEYIPKSFIVLEKR